MSKYPAKVDKVIETVRAAVIKRKVFISEHADLRMQERDVSAAEVNYILLKGFHEAKKDQFNELHNDWDYAIRGKTADARSIRAVIAISAPGVIVVTVIDLEKD